MSFFPLQACEELSIVSLLTLFEYSRPRLSSYAKAIINKTECGVLLRCWNPNRNPQYPMLSIQLMCMNHLNGIAYLTYFEIACHLIVWVMKKMTTHKLSKLPKYLWT